MALICDTGVLYSATDKRDEDHRACAALLAETEERIVVPAPVVVELEWLISSRMHGRVFDTFLAAVEEGSVEIEELGPKDYSRVRQLYRRYADLPLSLVDGAVVAVAERLGETKLASLDRRHLGVVRPRHVRAFTLLPG